MSSEEFLEIAQALEPLLVDEQGTVRFTQHEDHIRAHVESSNALHKLRIKNIGYEECLRAHYLTGSIHPDDCNLPLNQWDDCD